MIFQQNSMMTLLHRQLQEEELCYCLQLRANPQVLQIQYCQGITEKNSQTFYTFLKALRIVFISKIFAEFFLRTIRRDPRPCKGVTSLFKRNLYMIVVTAVLKEQRMTQMGGGTRIKPAKNRDDINQNFNAFVHS